MSDWETRLRENRAEKDDFFASDRRSPLSPADRESFDGLDYFPPDPAYRVEATVSVPESPDPVELTAENGPPERFLHAATFSFTLPRDPETASDGTGVKHDGTADQHDGTGVRHDETADEHGGTGEETVSETLQAYRREGDRELFVPFRDKTTGQETYRGGRYMDLHPESEPADGDRITLDFNLAYTPFCAFDDAFVCPLPPEDNWLSVAVRAGERDPPL